MKEQELIKQNYFLTDFFELNEDQRMAVIELLTDEFYQHNLEKGRKMFDESIRSGQEPALCLIDYTQEKVVGAITSRKFDYSKIAPQLFLQPSFSDNGELERIRFRRFGELLDDHGYSRAYIQAIELAYMTIDKQYRGRGLANNLFEVQASMARLPKDENVIFGLARSAYAGTSLQTELTKIMLECNE